jgi:hypothetical protein
MKVKVYKREEELGLADIVSSSAKVKFFCPAEIDSKPNKERVLALAKIEEKLKAVSNLQEDLFYMKDLMVSTGMNLNDDFFTNEEMLQARYTAKDKQFNIEHSCEIIGHITDQYLMDADGGLVPDVATEDHLNKQLHLISSSVIYKYWSDPDKQARINEIIDEIINKKDSWFVSMECLFPDFSYCMWNNKNEIKFVDRSEATSFLTKYLRAYGGTGVYGNYRIGRVFKNFYFSGKGLVRNPGNPNSIILNNFSKANINIELKDIDLEKQKMDELVKVKTELEVAKVDLMKSKANHEEVTKKFETEKKEKEETVKKLDEEKHKAEDLTKKVEVEKKEKEETTVKLAEASKKLADITIKNQELEAKIAKAEAEKKFNERVELVKKELNLDEAKAKEFAGNLSILNDEAFANTLKITPKAVAASGNGGAAAALDNAQAGKDVGSGGGSNSTDVEETRKSVASYYKASKGKTEEPKTDKK